MMQRQRREALEQEVSELKQQLSNEETVHQILERALQQPSSLRSSSMALTNIPAFIPTKAKELLAELLLVEDEIARLEGQIQRMKQGAGAGAGARGGGNSGAMAAMQQQPPSVAEHCKSMFFISQAMDGEAYLSKVKKSPNPNPNPHPKDDDRRAAMNSMRSPKNNIFFGGAAGLPPRHSLDNKQSSADGHVQVVDKSTNINKPPGSKIAAVLQHQHQHQHHNHELPITKQISPTVIAAAKRVRDQPQAQPPNKLSERIVKCLVCIFMRLLRSSRVSEMEKSGNLAAKGGSFRMDTGLVNAAANKEKQERGQQDHYGIFGVQDAIVRDIGPYKNLVRFTSTSLDLLRGFSASPLLTKLREMLEALQQVDVRSLNHQQRLAFWLNIYNTCIMHVRLSVCLSVSFNFNSSALQINASVICIYLFSFSHRISSSSSSFCSTCPSISTKTNCYHMMIYHALYLQGILQHGLPSNSDKLLALKNKVHLHCFVYWTRSRVLISDY